MNELSPVPGPAASSSVRAWARGLRRLAVAGSAAAGVTLTLGALLAPVASAQSVAPADLDPVVPGQTPQLTAEALAAAPLAGPFGVVLTAPVIALMEIPGTSDVISAVSASMPIGVSNAVARAVSAGAGYTDPMWPAPGTTTPTVVDRTPLVSPNAHGPAEYWDVTSAAMQKMARVEVYPAPTPGPILYLLDGLDNNSPSDFLGYDAAIAEARAAGWTVVIPTGAYASEYTDWIADDPSLGRNKWETFLTEELPPLVEHDPSIHFDGRRIIAGISMGAGGAVRIAANHPGMYRAVAGISGCYSALDDRGYYGLRTSVASRGGDVDNMWGPRGSADWQRNDIVSAPHKLDGMDVFLYAGNGAIGPVEAQAYGEEPHVAVVGATLEIQSNKCTHALVDAMHAAGMDPAVEFADAGIHNWTSFRPALADAVAQISRSLPPA